MFPKSSIRMRGNGKLRRHGRDTGYPAPPAQIPACGITAPGSSRVFASIFKLLVKLKFHLGLASFYYPWGKYTVPFQYPFEL
ncbi:hypothetical protein [Desulfosporosinus nitroreducens]|uniref:Uncharacterized protein n=1 Tax=Desulfosporosinus nitroreducens TaxID=2018668 RepID=A0ABT8QSQ0_9FIRM|nr:hypothetical protein [Desulfosporosinus nitroreducens]MCO1603489.1 hypothetical protein [Desulfosporosinus nitroreducens]MDO0824383.1 hypothetical protein [Desulfosporosinus nitroreducens]